MTTPDGWEEYEQDTKCGIGGYKPQWLQTLASKKSYVVVYGLVGMCQFAVGTYFVSTISTIEKRFKIPSRTSGNTSWSLHTTSSPINIFINEISDLRLGNLHR